MNENNYKRLDANKFISIVQGEDSTYIIPQTGTLRAGWMQHIQGLREAGIEPEISVLVPNMHERNLGKRKHDMTHSGVPVKFWPDFDDPTVYIINGNVQINREQLYTFAPANKKKELTYGVDLQNCEFDNSFSFYKVRSKGILSLNNCTFIRDDNSNYPVDGSFTITDSEFKRVTLSELTGRVGDNTALMREVRFDELLAEELIIDRIYVDDLIINSSKESIRKIIIKDSTIKNVYLNGDKFDQIEISRIQGQSSFLINGQFNKLTFSNQEKPEEDLSKKLSIQNLTFLFKDQINKGYYNIENIDISYLRIKGSNNNSVLIKKSFIKHIYFNDFTNPGELNFRNIAGINEFEVRDSTLGKAELLDVDLFRTVKTQVVHSNISDIVLLNTSFPDSIIGVNATDYKGIRDAYRQLKYSSGKQSNRIGELRYESLEMAAYKKDKSTPKSLTDKIILWTNEVFNKHGQDAVRAFCWLLGGTIVFYSLIKCAQGYSFNLAYTLSTIAEYLSFAANPLHDYYKLFNIDQAKETYSWGNEIAKFLDAFARLFSGYMIFQFLRAFRKFVK